jgi:hypothetical protein
MPLAAKPISATAVRCTQPPLTTKELSVRFNIPEVTLKYWRKQTKRTGKQLVRRVCISARRVFVLFTLETGTYS